MGDPVTFFITVAIIASVTSAVFSVIQAFQSPKPSKITFDFGDSSPRYGAFVLNNTLSNELAIPVLYGTLKVAGNLIWQSDPASTVDRIIGICEGEISAIGTVKANDILINATNTPGSSSTAYLGTGGQNADSRLPAGLRPDLAFHNLAYLALTLATSDSLKGGDPTITSICDGLLIETWNGVSWSTAKSFSRNPAACVRDFLLSARYGLGMAKANLNDTTFGEVYDYCEGLVDTATVKQARFRLDFVIDSQKPAQDVLNDMLATFGGFLVYAGNKVKLRCDRIDPIIQYFGDGSTTKSNAQFDPNNIVKDSFSWNMASIDDRPNRIKIQWVDPDQNYVKVYTQVEDRIDQDDRGTIITKEVALLGITRQTQAARMAKLMMAVSKYSHINVSFASRLESIQCEIGDVVAVTHQSARFIRRLFRIVDMQEAEDETIMFTCRDYNASIYDDHQGAAVITYTQPSGPNPYSPLSDVTGLTTVEDNFKQKDGVFATNILTSWTALSAEETLRLDRFLIQISSDGGANFRDVAFVSAQKNSYRIVLGNVQTGTTFVVRVKTVSDRGAESAGATSTLTIQGKRTPPSDVDDFDVTFAFDHIAMSWSAINDEDLFGYEIRVGNSDSVWETASIVTTEILGTRYDLFDFTRGTKKFFIKAIDNSSNYSENATSDSITISSIPESNVTFTFDVWSLVNTPRHPLFGTLSSRRSLLTGNSQEFNGATKYVEVPDSENWNLGTGNFTIEAWILPKAVGINQPIVGQWVNTGNSWLFAINNSDDLRFIARSGGSNVINLTGTASFTAGVWAHVAVCRSGNDWYFWKDGVQQGSTGSNSDDVGSLAATLRIGQGVNATPSVVYFRGRMDELRITKGLARYTATFSTQTTPFTTDSSTILLMHFDETTGLSVKDNSGLGNHGSVNTDPVWLTGKVLKPLESVIYQPAARWNSAYNRPVLTPVTTNTWEDYRAAGGTWLALQQSTFKWGREEYITTEESYETEAIDIGSVTTGGFILDLFTASSTNLGFISVQISTSSDGVTYTTYKTFTSGQYTARYVKFKFLIQATVSTTKVELTGAILTVDVPDIKQSFLDQSISAGGRTFYLSGFTKVKSIVLTTVGTASSLLSPQITDQSALPDSFNIKMFDKNDTGQAGSVNIFCTGY